MKRQQKQLNQLKRLQLNKPTSALEKQAKDSGYQIIAGVDEAGRGPLAGPVIAAACIFKEALSFPGIDDSKRLTPLRRRLLFEQITTHPQVLFGIGRVDPAIIDQINILQATFRAMREAVQALEKRPDYLLIDGNLFVDIDDTPGEAVVKGDQRSTLIAAASIIAKETRDDLMKKYHDEFPEYGFASHKGYGTAKHRAALEKFGPCPIHRMSFAPVLT